MQKVEQNLANVARLVQSPNDPTETQRAFDLHERVQELKRQREKVRETEYPGILA
jgi:hypothetical protein